MLENRRLPVVALFSGHPPAPEELIAQIELPFAARYVDDPPDLDARRIPSPPVLDLLDRAREMLDVTAIEIADIRTFVEALRSDPCGRVPRRPPSRSNSANPSQELCKSRSNSAK